MPVKSLTRLCMQKVIKNIHLVTSVGTDLPHDNPHVQKILSKINSAHQLHEIELNSPQLQGHTEKFWKELISRHFPSSRKNNYVPSNPSGWYKVYKRHKKEDEESLEAANATLKSAFNDIAAENQNNQSLLLNRSQLPKPPRTGRGLPRRGQQTANTSSLTFNAGSRTKLNSGKNVLKRARREAMDVAAQRGALGRLTAGSSSQVKTAPRSFLERSRVASQPAIRAPSGSLTRKPAPVPKQQFSPPDHAKSDEPEPVVIDVSDEEDVDPLFGEPDDEEPPAKKPRLGPKQSGYPPKDPLFDSDGAESSDAKEASKKAALVKGKYVAPTQPNPLKRKGGALLPGKPGAGRFLSKSSTAPGSKAAPSQKPAPAQDPASSAGRKDVVKTAQKASKATSSPANPSPVSATGGEGVAKSGPSTSQDSYSPQDKSATAGPSHPQPMLHRKKKVDIFMKPRKRP